jgi:hypothetical protein
MEAFFVSVAFAAGFAACWFSKDWLIMSYDGTWNWIKRVEAKVAKIKETL